MKIIVPVFVIVILYSFSFSIFSIEISDDLFMGKEGGDNAESEIIKTSEVMEENKEVPNIKKVYKKETVVIKRDISALQYAIEEELSHKNSQIGISKKKHHKFSRKQDSPYKKKTSIKSLDYGVYEVQWSREEND